MKKGILRLGGKKPQTDGLIPSWLISTGLSLIANLSREAFQNPYRTQEWQCNGKACYAKKGSLT